jgi:hypothetical protein
MRETFINFGGGLLVAVVVIFLLLTRWGLSCRLRTKSSLSVYGIRNIRYGAAHCQPMGTHVNRKMLPEGRVYVVSLGVPALRPIQTRIADHVTRRLAHLAIQLVQGRANPIEHFVAERRQAIDSRGLGSLGLGGAKPPALGHACQHGVERARTQAIAVAVQFFEHPLAIDALFVRVVQDVDFPEAQEELANNGIAHGGRIIARAIRNRYSITRGDR